MTNRPSVIRIAVVTSLYPNSAQPRHGIFVEERLRKLVADGEVEARVVAPVPWFFSTHPRFGRYATLAAVPRCEIRHGIRIEHPRFVVVPKIGMTVAPASMARAVISTLRRFRREGFDFDLIDAHYFYPDGVAAAKVARRLNRPLTITARGTDINVIAEMAVPRRQIRRAARQADGVIAVANALAEKIKRLGIATRRLTTLRNGVDLERFAMIDREAARQHLGVKGRVWLCVGHLVEGKGVHVAIDALAHTANVTLLICGDGPQEGALRSQAKALGVASRIRFVGAVAHDELPMYYAAADALIVASRSEGMPNVVLEALACGTAVLANPVGGIPEVVTGPPSGVLLQARSGAAVARAWKSLGDDVLSTEGRKLRRRYAESWSWEATTAGQLRMFRDILADRSRRQHAGGRAGRSAAIEN